MSTPSALRPAPVVCPPQLGEKIDSSADVEVVLKQYEGVKLASEEGEKSFIWPEGTRPDIVHDKYDFQLPAIDLSPLLRLQSLRNEIEESEDGAKFRSGLQEEIEACEAAKSDVARAIGEACEEYGFFQITNHGFPMEVVNQLTKSFGQLFELPLEEKMKIKEKDTGQHRMPGYTPMKRTTPYTRMNPSFVWNEGFDLESPEILFPGRIEEIANIIYPGEPERSTKGHLLRSSIEEYGIQASKLSFLLMDLIAASLGIPDNSVNSLFGDRKTTQANALMRVNCYPVCDHPELTWGIHGHTDPNLITLLHQDAVGGLQIRFRDGTWHGLEPVPGAFVINCGDCLQAWTNGKFLSAEHRVVANEKKRRMSIAYFAFSQMGYPISPRPECVDAEHPLRYKPFTMLEYMSAIMTLGLGRGRGELLEKAFGIQA